MVTRISNGDRFTATRENTRVNRSADIEKFFDSGGRDSHCACGYRRAVNRNRYRNSSNGAACRDSDIRAEVNKIICRVLSAATATVLTRHVTFQQETARIVTMTNQAASARYRVFSENNRFAGIDGLNLV